jgi:glucose-1-phosphate adenylyltransferase
MVQVHETAVVGARAELGEGVRVGPYAVVEDGAVVRESVVLPGAIVRARARVERAILDDRVEVGREATVGEPDGDIALVGLRATVDPGTSVPAGGRVPDPEA